MFLSFFRWYRWRGHPRGKRVSPRGHIKIRMRSVEHVGRGWDFLSPVGLTTCPHSYQDPNITAFKLICTFIQYILFLRFSRCPNANLKKNTKSAIQKGKLCKVIKYKRTQYRLLIETNYINTSHINVVCKNKVEIMLHNNKI